MTEGPMEQPGNQFISLTETKVLPFLFSTTLTRFRGSPSKARVHDVFPWPDLRGLDLLQYFQRGAAGDLGLDFDKSQAFTTLAPEKARGLLRDAFTASLDIHDDDDTKAEDCNPDSIGCGPRWGSSPEGARRRCLIFHLGALGIQIARHD
jgi:hypothetical protein